MTDCDRALEFISAALDGALAPEDARWLEGHLAHCPECRALQADFAAMHRLLPSLAPEAPAELKDRVLAAVEAEKVVPLPAGKKPRPARWRRWASLAAAVALVFLGGRVLYAAPAGGGAAPAAFQASTGTDLPAGEAAPAEAPGAAVREMPVQEAKTAGPESRGAEAQGVTPYAASVPEADAAGGENTLAAASAPLDEAGALEALLAHLGLTEADGDGFVPLGLSGDGAAWRFQAADGAVYAVPLDGGEITRETQS